MKKLVLRMEGSEGIKMTFHKVSEDEILELCEDPHRSAIKFIVESLLEQGIEFDKMEYIVLSRYTALVILLRGDKVIKYFPFVLGLRGNLRRMIRALKRLYKKIERARNAKSDEETLRILRPLYTIEVTLEEIKKEGTSE